MTRDEKKQKRIRQLKMRVVSTLLILCLVIGAGGCILIEKNKGSKIVVRVNGEVVRALHCLQEQHYAQLLERTQPDFDGRRCYPEKQPAARCHRRERVPRSGPRGRVL